MTDFSRRSFVALAAAAALRRWFPGFEPWIEVDAAAIRHNVVAVSRMVGGRPIIAVLKNNAYGLGLAEAGPVVDALDLIAALAVVRGEEARALRKASVRKPILLMGRAEDDEARDLVTLGVRLAAFGDDAPEQMVRLSRRNGAPVPVHLYVDTGMNRMGQRYDRAEQWLSSIATGRAVRIEGTFTELTEEADFDVEQARRLQTFAVGARHAGLDPGPLHAASSMEVVHRPETHLDMVRPGFALWGGYVTPEAKARGELRPAFALKARITRVERLDTGDGVSYERPWKAERPTWIAVLPVGHADGYPRTAVKGAEVLIKGSLYKVISVVSASHTVVEVGDQPTVEVGDVATLMGPDVDAIHPNTVAERSGTSPYDRYMHLSPLLRRQLIQ